ncbi:dynein axonemal assembly factor 5 [Conger conger]|uniref:dynein axonemal assembly factor 5 n=1 Tax=Conger conger TaxID=82655 RepID=UPI002A5A8FC6|nr:dynein axonemal assembly factor 5 [Conger conger]
MATGDERGAAEVLRALARHLNCLNEDSKNTRKRALESIRRETFEKSLSSDVLQEVFASILKSLLKCLSDPMERCRETAIQMIGDFIRSVPKPEDCLPYLIPAFTHRLGGKEILEPAEELRLSMVEVLSLTVEVCGSRLAPYLDDMVKILQRTIVDPYPEVKKETCKCTVNFARSIPAHFHMQAESLVKPLMQTVSHQHSRVRVAVVEATGAVIQYSSGKPVDDVLSHLAQRLFDDSPQVRKAVTAVVGGWLLDLPDRYSFFHKLIPLLLTSLTDEVPEIRLLAEDLWRRTGAQWEKENEQDLKDKLDFLLEPPAHYPPGVERPGLGCRELVSRNLSKLLPAVGRDLGDWLAGTRAKTARLLSVLLLHSEDHSTQHLQPLLATLYRGCADGEPAVVQSCLESAELLGRFVHPEVSLKLLLAHAENASSSSSSSASLAVLAAVLRGGSGHALRPHLLRIGDALAHPDLWHESQQCVYVQVLGCVQALLGVCEGDCGPISLQLLQVLLTVRSLSTEPQLWSTVEETTGALCSELGLAGEAELYRQHMPQLIGWLSQTQRAWTNHSIQRLQLQVLVVQSGPVIGEFLPLLMPLLQDCVQPSRDPEMRLHLFTLLSKLLLDAPNTLDSQGKFSEHLEVFLRELLLPNLEWHAGRTAAAIRTTALSCLYALLQGGGVSAQQLQAVQAQLTPRVLAALDEDSQTSRLLASRSLLTLLRLIGPNLHPDCLNTIYPELLKRADDSSQEVRSVCLSALGCWFSSVGQSYDRQVCGPHLQLLFQQLLLHMDDPEGSVQDHVLDVLKAGSSVHPELLRQEVEAVRDKQRSPSRCDQLLHHLQSIPRDSA